LGTGKGESCDVVQELIEEYRVRLLEVHEKMKSFAVLAGDAAILKKAEQDKSYQSGDMFSSLSDIDRSNRARELVRIADVLKLG
jgi:hypothetical protein